MEFATALRREITDRKATRRSKRLLELLDARPSKLRALRLKRLERHAAAAAGIDNAVGIDWSQIDWGKLFEAILALLLKLLPLIL